MKTVGLSLAVYGIVFGGITALFPHGKTEKALRVLIAVLMLSLILSSLVSLRHSFSFLPTNETLSDEIQTDSQENAVEVYTEMLESRLTEQLQTENLVVKFVQLSMDIWEDDSIHISKIQFCPADRANGYQIQKRIRDLCGCQTVIEVTS